MKYLFPFQVNLKNTLFLRLFVFTFLLFSITISGQTGEKAQQQSLPETVKRFGSKIAARNFQSVLDPCDPMSITFGQTINGSLTNSDCADPESAQVADVYSFRGTQGQAISSSMSSTQFDTFLVLFDANGDPITLNDDIDASTTNSRIPPNGTFTLPYSGQYFLFATSYDETGRGNYSLNLSSGGASSCDFTINPSSQHFTVNGGTGTFTVTASAANCAWQATSNAGWVTTSSSGTGSGSVTFTVAANTSMQSGRAAVITVGNKTFSITQNALSCSYQVFPIDPEIPAIGGPRTLTINASNSLCPSNISTNDSWITIQNPTGTGTRVVNYTLAPNNIPASRTGTFQIGDSQFGFLQLYRRTPFSFDSGAQANLSLFRPTGGLWLYKPNSFESGVPGNGFNTVQFGVSNDKPAPADYDGDGRTDIAVFRDGEWFIIESRNFSFRAVRFGIAGDKPLPADFDGDGRADINVFRPSTGDWFRLNSSNNQFVGIHFGVSEDVPVITDFNADGRSEIAVYRPSVGTWYWLDSQTSAFNAVSFGLATDIPVPADYDGDSKTDIAVFRPQQGSWYRINSTNNQFVAVNFGTGGDIPVPADYDFDGKADTAVYRPSNGTWYRLKSSTGFDAWQFGNASDKPLPAAYQP